MIFRKIFFVSISLLIFSGAALGKVKKTAVNKVEEQVAVDTVEVQVSPLEAYVDSLNMYKARLDSVYALNDSLVELQKKDIRYYRMFSPLAYYPDLAGKVFEGNLAVNPSVSLAVNDSDPYDNAIESALVRMYMERPELVTTTVKRLHASAARADKAPTGPVRRKVQVKQEEIKVEEVGSDGPVELFVYKPNFWKTSGDYSIQFMQSHLSENWYQSGESNLSMIGAATLQANFNNKQKIKWDNKLEMKLGFQTSESDTVHHLKTSSDLLRYTGKLGVQASKKWYYTFQALATTQFAHGLKSNDSKVYSSFLTPLTINLSLGMDYNVEALNKKLTGTIHIAPFAHNWKYVSRKELATRYGIEEGKRSLQDYGSQFTVNLQWRPLDNVKWNTRFYGYTTYHRMEMEWENTISMTINKYVSTNLFLYPRFDDSVKRGSGHTYFQFKEYFSLGFTYSM